MTDQETVMQQDPKAVLRAMVKAYTGKDPDTNATGKDLRAALAQTPRYKEVFAKSKDEGSTLTEMMVKQTSGVTVPAWLITGDKVDKKGDKVRGHGAIFRLADGRTRFVDYAGPLKDAGTPLTEYVFENASIIDNFEDGTQTYDIKKDAKPTKKTHGQEPPASDLTKPIQDCFKFVKKLGYVKGETYDTVLGFLTITSDKDRIRIFPPGQYNDDYEMNFEAVDSAGTVVRVDVDPQEAAQALGLSVDSPAALWKNRLAGMAIAANGGLSIFLRRGDKFFGEDGTLAQVAAAQGGRIKEGKEGRRHLDLTDLYDATTNPHPSIPVGDKDVYRMESYKDDEGNERWSAYVRCDQEAGQDGKPLPPTLDCIVKMSKKGKPYNEGRFALYLGMQNGSVKASESAKQMLLVD